MLELETDSAHCVSKLDIALVARWVEPQGAAAVAHTLGMLAEHVHLTAPKLLPLASSEA